MHVGIIDIDKYEAFIKFLGRRDRKMNQWGFGNKNKTIITTNLRVIWNYIPTRITEANVILY